MYLYIKSMKGNLRFNLNVEHAKTDFQQQKYQYQYQYQYFWL